MFIYLYVIVELPVIVNTLVYGDLYVCYCRVTSDCEYSGICSFICMLL